MLLSPQNIKHWSRIFRVVYLGFLFSFEVLHHCFYFIISQKMVKCQIRPSTFFFGQKLKQDSSPESWLYSIPEQSHCAPFLKVFSSSTAVLVLKIGLTYFENRLRKAWYLVIWGLSLSWAFSGSGVKQHSSPAPHCAPLLTCFQPPGKLTGLANNWKFFAESNELSLLYKWMDQKNLCHTSFPVGVLLFQWQISKPPCDR